MSKHVLELIAVDLVPPEVYFGHMTEMFGGIPHDEQLAETIGNDMVRNHLRVAEAFAAGFKFGQKNPGMVI